MAKSLLGPSPTFNVGHTVSTVVLVRLYRIRCAIASLRAPTDQVIVHG
jgi:hypothetical protein